MNLFRDIRRKNVILFLILFFLFERSVRMIIPYKHDAFIFDYERHTACKFLHCAKSNCPEFAWNILLKQSRRHVLLHPSCFTIKLALYRGCIPIYIMSINLAVKHVWINSFSSKDAPAEAYVEVLPIRKKRAFSRYYCFLFCEFLKLICI